MTVISKYKRNICLVNIKYKNVYNGNIFPSYLAGDVSFAGKLLNSHTIMN